MVLICDILTRAISNKKTKITYEKNAVLAAVCGAPLANESDQLVFFYLLGITGQIYRI